jgi:glycosyltransferase involved in cell wall biosynthesis
MMSDPAPVVSFVIPARNEAGVLAQTLESLEALPDEPAWEAIVVDGGSTDGTPEIAKQFDARLIVGRGAGRGAGRQLGARHAEGTWLAFLDADTTVRPGYLETMLSFVQEHELAGAASRCRVAGGWRTRVYELFFNHVLWRLSPPVFPGFHIFVRRSAYFDVGGFETGPNEDVTFSRRLGKRYPTGFCPAVLVETSGRRIDAEGLLRTTLYYTKKEWRRQSTLRELV